MDKSLAKKHCVPCEKKDLKPMTREAAEEFLKETPRWNISGDYSKIERVFKFQNFVSALSFVNATGDIAEAEGHHPDINISFGTVTLTLFTHSIRGLSENDFIVAAKIDELEKFHKTI